MIIPITSIYRSKKDNKWDYVHMHSENGYTIMIIIPRWMGDEIIKNDEVKVVKCRFKRYNNRYLIYRAIKEVDPEVYITRVMNDNKTIEVKGSVMIKHPRLQIDENKVYYVPSHYTYFDGKTYINIFPLISRPPKKEMVNLHAVPLYRVKKTIIAVTI